MRSTATKNYYEILQISPRAEQLVITKVYRLLAAYYHPDNRQTGNEERFKDVIEAYEVLSDPARRSQYNAAIGAKADNAQGPGSEEQRSAHSTHRETLRSRLDQMDVPSNGDGLSERDLRKLLLLALYDVRRNNPGKPEISLLVLSELLGCHVDDLEFTNWYLKEKGLIRINESANFSITVAGVDYVEGDLLKGKGEKTILSLPESTLRDTRN
ncbi:MAG: DnaJ domain-containing protein [Acidobacteriota bacterium]